MSRRIEVTFINGSCVYVTGFGARELITEVRGRPPVWSSLGRAWVIQPSTARDLIAACEARGHDVRVLGGTTHPGQLAGLPAGERSTEPGEGLW